MTHICNKIKEIIVTKRYEISIILLIILGITVRLIGIDVLPNSANVDEISSGYEAYSILNYGIDRNGNFLPIFLQAWGSGQNALLTYLIIPFIKILGLNILAVRLPMAIISSISVVLFYLILRKMTNKKIARIGLAFFAICPWHIMKSRWGLESNLFPDLILFAIYFIIKGLESNKKQYHYLGFVILGLSSYAYGTSYLFLPIFVILLLAFLYRKKQIKLAQGIFSLAIVAVISFPIMLYVIINIFDLPQINLPFMTIPKLEVNRFQEITSIFLGKNISDAIEIFIKQYDGLEWNAIEGYGIIYVFSTVFTIIGIIRSFKAKEKEEIKYNSIFNIWLIAGLCILPVCEPNINRLNIIIIPIIYYTILGIDELSDKKYVIYAITGIYIISFALFMQTYIKQDSDKLYTFEGGLEEPIKYIDTLKDKQIYITNKIKEPYIYVLFYTEYNTKDFVDTVRYANTNSEFRQVDGFNNYYFTEIEDIENNKNIAYMIKSIDKDKYKLEDFKVTEFDKYIVIEGTK